MLSDEGGCPVGQQGVLQDEMGTQGCGRGASGGQLRRLQGSCHRMGVCPALAEGVEVGRTGCPQDAGPDLKPLESFLPPAIGAVAQLGVLSAGCR